MNMVPFANSSHHCFSDESYPSLWGLVLLGVGVQGVLGAERWAIKDMRTLLLGANNITTVLWSSWLSIAMINT